MWGFIEEHVDFICFLRPKGFDLDWTIFTQRNQTWLNLLL